MFERAKKRERELTATIASMKKAHKAEIDRLEAQIKDLHSQLSHMKHMIFGRSTEKKSRSKQNSEKQGKNTTRPSLNHNRGHQPGTQGPGRRKHENLPIVDQEVDLPDNDRYCATCRLPFKPHPGCDHCDVIEIQVKPHIRRYHRKRYLKPVTVRQRPLLLLPRHQRDL